MKTTLILHWSAFRVSNLIRQPSSVVTQVSAVRDKTFPPDARVGRRVRPGGVYGSGGVYAWLISTKMTKLHQRPFLFYIRVTGLPYKGCDCKDDRKLFMKVPRLILSIML